MQALPRSQCALSLFTCAAGIVAKPQGHLHGLQVRMEEDVEGGVKQLLNWAHTSSTAEQERPLVRVAEVRTPA